MNLDGLLSAAERATRRTDETDREDALQALAGRFDAAQIRYVRLSDVDISSYLQPGDVVELHRSLLPKNETDWAGQPPGRKFGWTLWTAVRVERLGDCVRVLVPNYGSMPIPVGDFVRGVLAGRIRAPAPG